MEASASASASAPESIDFTTITPQDILNMVGDDLPEDQMIIDELNEKIAEFVAAGTLPEDFTIETIKMKVGGRRHKGSKKAHKKSRKGNKMLSSWVAFVKKVQHEEKISYSDAMKRASARKKEWKRGQMGGDRDTPGDPDYVVPNMSYADPDDELTYGGRRRRRTKRRGTKKRRGSRRRR
jgi:hypothetical protein